jgi:two-component system, NtrC family, sensor kinase
MRLKSSIFLWVSLATILPLTALVLGITAYSERLHRQNVDKDIRSNMENIISEMNFRLNYEREVIMSLASSPAMQQFSPILIKAAEGDLHPDYFDETEKLNDFLAGFQHSVPGLDTVRVLDIDGNTLVKVRFGKHLPALFEGMQDIPLAEEELTDAKFLQWMHKLEAGKLVYGQLPLSRRDYVSGRELSLFNSIVPLTDSDNKNIGFLTARAQGDQLDRILKTIPRSHQLKINIVELNADNPLRHGMLLYSDDKYISFNELHEADSKIHYLIDDNLWSQLQNNRYGSYSHSKDSQRYYYQEFYPYANQLVSWAIILKLDNDLLAAPFQRIRFGLLGFALLALIISLVLANMGARHIAEPIIRFSRTLKNYADGDTELKELTYEGADELQELDVSFHYLAETLEIAKDDRDRAQKMMLQKAKLASIGEMAAGIGHEINNPLNNILSYTKLIKRDTPNLTQDLEEDLSGLKNEALRASRIVKGILNFARQVPPEYNQFNIIEWLNDTLILVESEAHRHHVKLSLKCDEDFSLEGDRQQLQQVLLNLLINAIQANKKGEVVELTAQKIEMEQVKIVVSDNGGGITKEVHDKIFDPFFTTKNVGEGSGLGLSISLGIVEYHHGLLKLENNDHGGTDAIIILPLHKV